MCLLNCAHGDKANVQLEHVIVNNTVEGWMKTRFEVKGGVELFWDYSASTDKKCEEMKCSCNAVPGVTCWVVLYEPPLKKRRLKKRQ